MKADFGQGWLFGKAVPLAELKAMLSTSHTGVYRKLI